MIKEMKKKIATLMVLVFFDYAQLNGAMVISSTSPVPVHTLLLCRHGDSIWNGGHPGCQETFTGWTDVPLSDKGLQEAKTTGEEVASYSYNQGIDACFTSILSRAKYTAHHVLWSFSNKPSLVQPRKYISDYRLNERHYGALQGFIKREVEEGKYGHHPDDVSAWRRSWYAVPPLLQDDDPRRLKEIEKYQHYCFGPENIPRGESLEMVAKNRIKPFLDEVLHPVLMDATIQRGFLSSDNNDSAVNGGTGLVVAHANSLRALIGVLCRVEEDDKTLKKLESMKISTGVPLILRYRQLDDGSYQACDLNQRSSQKNESKGNSHDNDLPVYPLSSIPKYSSSVNQNTVSRNVISTRQTAAVRLDVI